MTNVRALPRITAVELGTVVWPNGYDLDPDVLHGDHVARLSRPPRRISLLLSQRSEADDRAASG
jgi:hypothetical protein